MFYDTTKFSLPEPVVAMEMRNLHSFIAGLIFINWQIFIYFNEPFEKDEKCISFHQKNVFSEDI